MALKIPSGKALNATMAQGAGLALGFLVHLSLAHVLKVESYGLFNFIFSIASTISMFAVFGLQSAAQRIIPGNENNPALVQAYMKFSWLFTALFGASISGLVFIALAVFYDQSLEPQIPLYTAGFLTALAVGVMRLQGGFLKAYHKGTWSILYEIVFREFPVFIAIWISVFIGTSLDSATAALSLYAATSCSLIIISSVHINKLKTKDKLNNETNRFEYKKWLIIAAPMMLIMTTQMLLHRSDIIILGLMVPLDDVGSYSFGAKLSHAASIAVVGAATIFSPRASKLFKAKDGIGLHEEFVKTRKFMVIGTLTIATFLGLGIHIVLHIFPDYADALWAFYILVAGYCLNAFWGPSTYLLIMTGQEQRMMWMTFATVAFNIVATLALVVLIGPIGAAISTALALNLRNAYAYRIYLQDYVDFQTKD